MKRMVLLVIGIIFVGGCQNTKLTKSAQKKPQEITTQHCDLKSFTTLVAGGNAKVELASGADSIDITGIQQNRFVCPSNSRSQTLDVSNIANRNINAVIKISAANLKNITVTDGATISAQAFKANNLTVVAKDYGTINLAGHFNIKQIFQLGSGRINIDWIDSDSLNIEGQGHGPIYLAGRVNNLQVKLTGNAKLYARYLRAQKASAFTTDNALAEVMALDTLSAYAIDNSNIHYYKRPKDITIVTRDSGSVLYPHWE